MSLPVMKQMVDRGRLVFSQFAEQLNYKAASAASHPWTALHDHNLPPTDPYKDSPIEQHIHSSSSQTPTMVFLGAPGAGKGTYSTRVAKHLGLTPIAAGDLVREIMASGSERGQKMKSIVNSGNLLPDSIILAVLQERLAEGRAAGERGVLLDGFPRTRAQAEALVQTADVRMAVNLSVREEILISKCLGRRFCEECGKNFNVADIYIPENGSQQEVNMPPLDPPPQCQSKLKTRSDDNLETIKRRLEVYHSEATPVEDFFREQGTLVDFQIHGGIQTTLPELLAAVAPFASDVQSGRQTDAVRLDKISPGTAEHSSASTPASQERAHA